MLHCGRLLDGPCVAVAAAVDRCRLLWTLWVELLLRRCGRRRLRGLGAGGGLLSCRTGKSPSYVTHAPMVHLPVASARGPGDERKRGGDLRRVQAADPGTGGGKATPNTQQLSRGTKDPTLTTET